MTVTDICTQLMNHHIGIIEHDTVPGIVGLMTVENAKKIITLKKRAPNKGFIILIPNPSHLPRLTTPISTTTQTIIHRYWPGPLTIIFKKNPTISTLITGTETTIAIRYPDHPILSTILNKINQPLLSTSANMSGKAPSVSDIVPRVDFTFGDLTWSQNAKPSTIVDSTTTPPIIRRPGAIAVSLPD
ncbi:MAG: L-threonylcarbamoyladenylate synthase [Candidatus Marinamargulisbacteria bacterium]